MVDSRGQTGDELEGWFYLGKLAGLTVNWTGHRTSDSVTE